MTRVHAACLALVMLTTTMTGCFSAEPDNKLIASSDLTISPEVLVGAQFQTVEFSASSSMSVHVPYLVMDHESGYVVNGTTLYFNGAGTASVEMLAPSNLNVTHFLLGELGRVEWPLRETNQSWAEWFSSSKFEQFPYTHIEHPVERENDSAYTIEDGALHSTGLIDGLNVFEWLELFADPDSGYNERWGPFTLNDPTYMRAVNFMQGELQGMGYDAQVHRYWISDFSYAVNVCGYKEGTMFPDEWLVLGAHLDVAEAGSPPGGGTRIGAHDNGAGVALVLEAA